MARSDWISRSTYSTHGADTSGAVAFRKKLRRNQVLSFFAALPPYTVAMEACAGAHYWGREIGKLGQLGQESRCRLEISRPEPFSEAAVNPLQEVARLANTTLAALRSGETYGSPQFSRQHPLAGVSFRTAVPDGLSLDSLMRRRPGCCRGVIRTGPRPTIA